MRPTRAREGALKALARRAPSRAARRRAAGRPAVSPAAALVRTASPYRREPRGYPRSVPELGEHTGEVEGLPVFWRSASPPAEFPGGAAAPLYLHGVPTNSDEWLPFLERTGGLAPDLPGFGRSGKPGSRRYTIAEYDRFIERFLELSGARRVSLVMHDWGAVGLAFAQRRPELIERLVLINAVTFLPGYRWHRTARIWRTPGLGELSMGTTNRRVARFLSRESNVTPGPMPEAWLDSVLEHFDQGTQRAILRLYRNSSPEVLEAAGAQLGRLEMPALVVWGMRDPYLPARFGRAYADALPHARLIELPDAGHWAWLDRPDAIDSVVSFLGAVSP
jgi:pimeloyl-ACP methyl ester carboxylesterase